MTDSADQFAGGAPRQSDDIGPVIVLADSLFADTSEAPSARLAGRFRLDALVGDPLIRLIVGNGGPGTIAPNQLVDAHAVLASELLTVDQPFLAAAPELLVVARYGVGLDAIDLAACTAAGVLVTVTPEGIIRPVASAAMALMLHFAHQLDARRLTGPTSDWDSRRELVAPGLSGSTLGIVGLGRIGAELARLARPFGVRLIGCDPHTSAETASTLGLELTDLEQLLRRADLVCLCCPLTVDTRHMISTEALNAMKPTAFLINVARGGLVDERALEHALTINTIAGAGLDVFELEPLPPDSPLRTLPNVVPTPHSLAWTEEYFRRSGRSATDAIRAVAMGAAPTHVANPEVLGNSRLQIALQHRSAIEA